ncbi:hypothetical protein CRG98_034862, partial [Punica granatum]
AAADLFIVGFTSFNLRRRAELVDSAEIRLRADRPWREPYMEDMDNGEEDKCAYVHRQGPYRCCSSW